MIFVNVPTDLSAVSATPTRKYLIHWPKSFFILTDVKLS